MLIVYTLILIYLFYSKSIRNKKRILIGGEILAIIFIILAVVTNFPIFQYSLILTTIFIFFVSPSFPILYYYIISLNEKKVNNNHRDKGTQPITPSTILPKSIISPEKIKTLEKLIRVSDRVKIDDIAAILEIPRRDLLLKMLDLSDKYNFKIQEEIISFEDSSIDEFLNKLDQEFVSWSKSTEKIS